MYIKNNKLYADAGKVLVGNGLVCFESNDLTLSEESIVFSSFKKQFDLIIIDNKIAQKIDTNFEEDFMRRRYTDKEQIAILLNKDEDQIEYNRLIEWKDFSKTYSDKLINFLNDSEIKSDLDIAKEQKLNQLRYYDSSSNVNGFIYDGQDLWIDKATRVGLVNATHAAIATGNETMTFGIQGIVLTLPCTQILQILYELEMYALECYNITLQHRNNIITLTDIESVKSYNYTLNYPQKLVFNI